MRSLLAACVLVLVCVTAHAADVVSDEGAQAARDDLDVLRAQLRTPWGMAKADPITAAQMSRDKKIMCEWMQQHNVSREERHDYCVSEAAADDAVGARRRKDEAKRVMVEEAAEQAQVDAGVQAADVEEQARLAKMEAEAVEWCKNSRPAPDAWAADKNIYNGSCISRGFTPVE